MRLKSNTLESIQAENSGDLPACLTSMVREWLKMNYNVMRFGEPTWQWLVEAVGHPAGGANMALARDIARKHKAKGMYSTRYIHGTLGKFSHFHHTASNRKMDIGLGTRLGVCVSSVTEMLVKGNKIQKLVHWIS